MSRTALILFLALISTGATAIKPEREYKWTPDKRGLRYSEFQVTTRDKYSINVWEYFLPDSLETTRTIILVGSDAGNMGYSISQAKAFLSQGIRVIAFDYRGFGKSADFAIDPGLLYYQEFGLDLDSVIRMTRDKYPNDNIGLYALSMGTYIAFLRTERIDFSIAEGFYANPMKVVDRIKLNKGEVVLLPPHAKAFNKIRRHVPTLIFCASNDKTTITADAKEFARKNKTTIIQFDGDHLNGMYVMMKDYYGDGYASRVLEFLVVNGL